MLQPVTLRFFSYVWTHQLLLGTIKIDLKRYNDVKLSVGGVHSGWSSHMPLVIVGGRDATVCIPLPDYLDIVPKEAN